MEELQSIIKKKELIRNEYANERRRPNFIQRFKSGDLVQHQNGRIFQLIRQVAPFTFLTSTGVRINTRNIHLWKRPIETDTEISVRTQNNRYPLRSRTSTN